MLYFLSRQWYSNTDYTADTPAVPDADRKEDRMFQVVTGRKLYEQVVDQIKSMIDQGVYKKGDMLPSEKELIDMTGVSRITVREALRTLSEAGVIETRRGKGSFVLIDAFGFQKSQQYDASYRESFLSVNQVRLWLEPEVARHVAQTATEEDISKIGHALRASVTEDPLETFHLSIVEAAKNPLLLTTFRELISKEAPPPLVELVVPERQKRTAAKLQHQHERVFEAIRTGNGEFAYFYMKEHPAFLMDTYQQYFNNFFSKDGK